uniref:Uncharacterized protein n=1 Tax=Knipowitschia caucasica TaxID=637954 RepID=A0AAV2KUR7_KNICA
MPCERRQGSAPGGQGPLRHEVPTEHCDVSPSQVAERSRGTASLWVGALFVSCTLLLEKRNCHPSRWQIQDLRTLMN